MFLCTGNSCRSQMAEGWANKLWPRDFSAVSAGTKPQGMNPITVRVMSEVDVDISDHESKSVDDLDLGSIDVVATVCDDAKENCPVLPGVGIAIHNSFPDPYRSGQDPDDEATLDIYRSVRDEIRNWVEQLPEQLQRSR